MPPLEVFLKTQSLGNLIGVLLAASMYSQPLEVRVLLDETRGLGEGEVVFSADLLFSSQGGARSIAQIIGRKGR